VSRGTSPQWILTGARMWTGAGGPPGAAVPNGALAIRKGRILVVGRAPDVENLRGPDTAVIDLEGRFLMPGFVDAHVHLMAGGLAGSRIDLRGCGSPEEFVRRVADGTRGLPEGAWLLGGGWNEEDWGGEPPTRGWLDRAAPERPVFLFRTDLHTGLASSRALAMAGLDGDAPDPENGIVDRDPETDEPTGILREHAIPAVTRIVPPPSDEERRAALRAACRTALAGGITQVHDMGSVQSRDESWTSFRLFRHLREEADLPLRAYTALPVADWRDVAAMVRDEGRGDSRLAWGMVKGFVDGSLGSSTAWFHEPYEDDPQNRGTPITDLDQLREDLGGALAEGLQAAVHAIGDRAIDWIFRVWEESGAVRPRPDAPPFRVEHAQHLSPAGVARCGLPGMILSVQPYHLMYDAASAPGKLGSDRESRSLAFRSMEEAGARLAFGSDWPVAPLEPIRTLKAAIGRVPDDPGGAPERSREEGTMAMQADEEEGGVGRPWLPGERVSRETALRAHTVGAARAGLLAGETGSLEVGKRADLAVLSGDPFRTELADWDRKIRVDMTFVDGVLAFRAGGGDSISFGGGEE